MAEEGAIEVQGQKEGSVLFLHSSTGKAMLFFVQQKLGFSRVKKKQSMCFLHKSRHSLIEIALPESFFESKICIFLQNEWT